jgi:hypothetical protein
MDLTSKRSRAGMNVKSVVDKMKLIGLRVLANPLLKRTRMAA